MEVGRHHAHMNKKNMLYFLAKLKIKQVMIKKLAEFTSLKKKN